MTKDSLIGRSWKDRLYDSYVSSKHAFTPGVDANPLHARAVAIRHFIKSYVPNDRSLSVLDLGCGYGAYVYFLKEAGYAHVRGVDVSAEQVELAHQLGIPEVTHQTLAECLDATPDNSVGVVLLLDILEHMDRQELFDMLDEVMRILQPGGTLIAHLPNAEGLYGMRMRYGDFTHELAFTPRSVQQVWRVIGFEDTRCFEDKPLAYPARSLARRLIWDAGSFMPRLLLRAENPTRQPILTQNMYITARKPL